MNRVILHYYQVSLSEYLSLSLSLSLSLFLSLSHFLYLSIFLYPYIYLSLSISVSIYLYLSLYLSIFIYLYLYLSISISIFILTYPEESFLSLGRHEVRFQQSKIDILALFIVGVVVLFTVLLCLFVKLPNRE